MRLIAKTAAFVALSATTVALGIAGPAQAADFSFRGTFANNNDVQLFNFTVGSPSDVILKTLSYAGGTQADGTVVSRGGFDPILSLFNGSGTYIASNDDGGSLVPADTNGLRYDTYLRRVLDPGSYTVAVSQFSNFSKAADARAGNLSQGFRYDNNFLLTAFDGRTNAWAFDVLNVERATVPNPTPVPTPALLPGLIGLGLGVLRKRKAEAAASSEA